MSFPTSLLVHTHPPFSPAPPPLPPPWPLGPRRPRCVCVYLCFGGRLSTLMWWWWLMPWWSLWRSSLFAIKGSAPHKPNQSPPPPPPKSIPSHPTHAPPRLLLRIGPLELPTLLSPRHQLGRGRRRRPRPRRLQLPLLLMPRRLRLLVQPLPAVPSFGVASVREQG